jgi:hypothetical protein
MSYRIIGRAGDASTQAEREHRNRRDAPEMPIHCFEIQ